MNEPTRQNNPELSRFTPAELEAALKKAKEQEQIKSSEIPAANQEISNAGEIMESGEQVEPNLPSGQNVPENPVSGHQKIYSEPADKLIADSVVDGEFVDSNGNPKQNLQEFLNSILH